MHLRTQRISTSWRVIFRVNVALWGSLIPGLLLLLAFGEPGLVACLLLYLVGLVLATRMLVHEYRHSASEARISTYRKFLFGIDAIAGATLMLGAVLEVSGHSYRYIYIQLGLLLVVAAVLLLAASIVWAVIHWSDTRDRFLLIYAFTFTWVSLMGALGLLLAPIWSRSP